jgi:hypothetical protein
MFLSKFKLRFPDLSSVDDETVQDYLDDAADKLSEDQILEDNTNYDKMQAAWAAHLAFLDGRLKAPVISERVGDVGISYHDNQQNDGYTDQWERSYYRTRANTQGWSGNVSDTSGLPLW